MLSDTGISQLTKERYIAASPDLSKLLLCPDGSLGQSYANYITGFGFDTDFYRKVEIQDDVSYLLFRLRQTHDIWHVLTGFQVDVMGEIGLKAFELAQTNRPLSGVLIAGIFLQTLFSKPQELDRLLAHISQGYRMGVQAKPLLAQKWEVQWEKPLNQWRQELDLVPVIPN